MPFPRSIGPVAARLPILLVALALGLLGAAASHAELLANDSWISGQAVNFQGGFAAGETAAVRLVPTGPCPCQVDEVRFLFGGGAGTHDVTLRIWDDTPGTAAPGAEIYSTTVQLTGANEFMQSIDLRSAGVMVPGAFRVGLEFTHGGPPSVASDIGGINLGFNFIDEITFGWFDAALFGVTGDWVIRAVVDSGTLGPGTLLANDGWLPGQSAAFQGGFAAGETAAVRLLPPGPCPCRFDKIQFLFGGAGGTHDVTFRIWDDSALTDAPGAELYSTTVQVTGTEDFMQEIDLSAVGLMVDGPIRVGLEFSHAGLPSVARDDDGLIPGRNFVDEQTQGWVESSTLGLTGDWIIRGVLDAAPSASGTLLANDSWLPSQTAAFEGGFVPGETAASRFLPAGPCPCRLDKIQFLFGGGVGTHDVTLRIWDDAALTDAPGAELYSTTLQLTGSAEFMQEVDLGVLGIMVSGPFRVGLEFTHSGFPSVARDDDGITPGRNFIDDTTQGWVDSSQLGLTGDWILRAVLDAGAAGAGELVNNDTWVPGQAVAFQAGFAAGETTAARFVPAGPCPCSLDKIRFLFGGAATTETVTLRIWEDGALGDAPGAQLYSAVLQLTGSDLFMQELDLTVAGIVVNGPFRVGFELQHAGLPSLARDDDGITADRNFIDDASLGWVEASTLGLSGDWVLRAVLDSVPGTVLAADSWASAAAPAFQQNLLTGHTAAVRLFPAGPCPCPLEDVRFLLGGAASSELVTLRIWDDGALAVDPGAELYAQDIAVTGDDQVMQVVDLSGAGVSVTGAFRVGVELRNDAPPSVAVDGDGITPGRSFLATPSLVWSDASTVGVTGDYIIRATQQEGPAVVPALPVWGACALALGLVLGAVGKRRTVRAA